MKKSLFKLALSVALIIFVLQMTNVTALANTLVSIPLWTFLSVFLAYIVGQMLSAYKWLLIARSSGMEISFPHALRAYFSGMFVNSFGFGIVGGDLARALLISKGKKAALSAIASVFADRAHGLCTLAFIGMLTIVVGQKDGVTGELLRVLIGVVVVMVVGWLFGPPVLKRLFRDSNRFQEKANQIASAFPKDFPTVLAITVLSFTFHSLQITLNWVIGLGMGVELPLLYLFAAIPAINILSSLPITWNGIGVRESAYIFFFTPLYLRADQAAALGAVWLLVLTAASALGGIVALANHDFGKLRKRSKSGLYKPESDRLANKIA